MTSPFGRAETAKALVNAKGSSAFRNPTPIGNQAVPFHRAMELTVSAPELVKLPTATKSPEGSSSMSYTWR